MQFDEKKIQAFEFIDKKKRYTTPTCCVVRFLLKKHIF